MKVIKYFPVPPGLTTLIPFAVGTALSQSSPAVSSSSNPKAEILNSALNKPSVDAYGTVDANCTVGIATNTCRVKDVTNDIEVDPLPRMNVGMRLAAFRSVYLFPSLNRYVTGPLTPIRISVSRGDVTLSGVVDSEGASDVAAIRANSLSGVFKVYEQLQVMGDVRKE